MQEVRQALLALLTHLVVINSSLTQQCLHKLVGALLPPPFVLAGQDADALEADQDVATLQQEVSATIERVPPPLLPSKLSHASWHSSVFFHYKCLLLQAVRCLQLPAFT